MLLRAMLQSRSFIPAHESAHFASDRFQVLQIVGGEVWAGGGGARGFAGDLDYTDYFIVAG